MRGCRAAAFAIAALTLAGCSALRHPAAAAIGVDVDDLDPASLALAAERSAVELEKLPASRTFPVAGRPVSAADLADSARHVAGIARSARDQASLTQRLARDCSALRSGGEAKVTAYYEPELAARRSPDRRFRYPLYRAPSVAQRDLLRRRLGRVPTRDDIDRRDVLRGLGLELAWVDDPVARFFLHVQGSGRLVLADGAKVGVGFADSNGLAYRSVGAQMVARGLLERGNANASAMRAWLTAHPDRRDAVLAANPRYIFFRDTGREGPAGALGATLVAGRSVAVDQRYVPRGILAWLRTTRPLVSRDGGLGGRRALTRFVFAQDAGAAIEGPARVDLFVGSGEEAGFEAGFMNEGGELWVLLCGRARTLGGRLRFA